MIDYTREDFTQNGETYDLIFDIPGKGSFARSKLSLKPNGRYLYVSFNKNPHPPPRIQGGGENGALF